jgi:signal transduction histidine kinase
VAQTAEQLLKSPQWQVNLDDVLAQLGKAANVSRVYIVENEPDQNQPLAVKGFQEWRSQLLESNVLLRTGESYEALGIQDWIPALEMGQPVFGLKNKWSQAGLLSDEAAQSGSFVLMPIFADSDWWGFIGFEDEKSMRVWEEVELEALGTAAKIMGAALQRQITEKSLYQAQKMESIGLLAGGIAHDFNNFLTGILAQSSISLYKLPAESNARTHVLKTIQIAEQAADLVRQLLGYSGRGQFEVRPIDLNDVIGENSGLIEMISRKKATLKLSLEPQLSTVEADPSQIQQVLMNLVINATESIEDTGGLVHISTEEMDFAEPVLCVGTNRLQPGRYVCLQVSDSGSGMRPETMTHIFDPFYTTKSTGRGLGLSATLGIVKAHGGGVQVQSQWQQGSRVQVYLPISGKASSDQATGPTFEGEFQAVILVIDDEEMILEPVKDGLEMMGAKVLVAENGRRGIEIYREHHKIIDLVILDMTMPTMDGRETFLRLQAINPRLKVILSSGYSEMETIRKFAEDEVISFLRKPYRFENLYTEVGLALKKIRS